MTTSTNAILYNLDRTVRVFGSPVPEFPMGISDAFDRLMKSIPGGHARSYFGVSSFDSNGSIRYFVMAEETHDGEAKRLGFIPIVLPAGNYLTVSIKDWRTKTAEIAGVFDVLLKDRRIDRSMPCVEWYKSEEEMLCMIKTRETQN